ncbi:hypothetical protein NQ317_015189 [Molorchus minor]|uniref:Peptidase aspartic putative domain-containing protein n=1 Tax=Molorchus minor TaxID=1323400 RepID=A0ABQ9IPX0_9CUCU|nr:hypothetical protein NQ317_015189 [Molorchus minor]
MSELQELKKKRGQVKGSLTRFKNYYESCDVSQINSKLICELKRRLDNVNPLLEQFKEIQSQIELLTTDEAQLIAEEVELVDFETIYYSLVGSVDELLQTYFDSKNSSSSNSVKSTVNEVNREVTSRNNNNNNFQLQLPHLHLPIMKVPTFNGNYNEWVEFKDAFISIIDSSKDALETIRAIPTSTANYKLAWQALVDHYEKGSLIIRSHVRAILDYPRILKESAKDLKNLYNNINNNLESLKNLGEPTDKWDALLIPIITDKCDNTTKQQWEVFCTKNNAKKSDEVRPGEKLSDLLNILKIRCELLQKLDVNPQHSHSKYENKSRAEVRKGQSYASTNTSNPICCFYCKKGHTIYQCEAFLKHPISTRIDEITKLKLCKNCLRPNHNASQCQSSACRRAASSQSDKPPSLGNSSEVGNSNCNNALAPDDCSDTQPVAASTVYATESIQNKIVATAAATMQVLLSTATVLVQDSRGEYHQCRALLDSGSTSNFVTQKLCEKLHLKLSRVNYAVTGVGNALSNVQSMANLQILSNDRSFKDSIQCLVLKQITTNIPTISFDKRLLKIPDNLILADYKFNESNSIDLLLGSASFWQLLCTGRLQSGSNQITLYETKLGWIIAGSMCIPRQITDTISCFSIDANTNKALDNSITKFWDIEEVNAKPNLSKSEQFCENHFKNTYKRDQNGQFIVAIPFKDNYTELGQSREFALKRFYSQERRLLKNPQLYIEYSKFMTEYQSLGHMAEINEKYDDEELNYYLPHHPVIKESSLTTRVRIVYDASMKSDSGLSLNDVQHVGPTIQSDIFSIMLRFRMYSYVMTADISKMYRMVLIDPSQTRFQRIFWRDNVAADMKCYELKTVTYGTASAPYLAVRCLVELANQYETIYPAACNAIKNCFYVDDFLCGAHTESELVDLQRNVSKILSSGGFKLRKWLCNKQELYEQFQISDELESSILQLGESQSNRTLGVCWNASLDTIQYVTSISEIQTHVSKRTILSEISQIYDPLGLLGPIIIVAKLIIQRLWEAKVSWDDSIPQTIRHDWLNFRTSLQFLNSIKTHRQVTIPDCTYFELHGFADASERAFSSFKTLQATIGWCFRFISNCKLTGDNKQHRRLGNTLSVEELNRSIKIVIQSIQRESFPPNSTTFLESLAARICSRITDSFQIGSLVLLKEENVPPLQWQLGRVVELHPGRDGVTRVVSIKLSGKGIIKRAVTKICALPVPDEINFKGLYMLIANAL